MARSIVTEDQFEISDKGIAHKPTGWSFTPYPGNMTSGHENPGSLGSVLTSGEEYRPDEVKSMAEQLWRSYCKNRDTSEPAVETGQTLAAQGAAPAAPGCAKVFREKVCGAKIDRAELANALARREPGDVLVVAARPTGSLNP